jgi:hypothetical protein
MKSAPPAFLALLLFVASMPACNSAQAQPPPAPPPTKPGPAKPANAPPAADRAEVKPPQTWSDPRVVAQLVEDCRFDPDALPEDQKEKWQGLPDTDGPQIPGMTCDYTLSQSCDGDVCYEGPNGATACNQKCTDGCRACGKTCAVQCHQCKSKCVDHACRVACAQGCATCHETCTRTRDRCSTGACKKNYDACWATLAATWRNNNCDKPCAKLATCVERCLKGGTEQEPCEKRCLPKDTGACELERFCSRGEYQTRPPTDR